MGNFSDRTNKIPSKVKVQKAFVRDAISGTAQNTQVEDRFPWYTPSLTDVKAGDIKLFPEDITDTELEARYRRYQLAKVIVNDVAEDVLRGGFLVQNPDDQTNEDFDVKFQKLYRKKSMRN